MNRRVWLLALLLSLGGAALAETLGERARALPSGKEVIPLSRAISLAEERYAGTVIEAEVKAGRPREKTPLVYELRLLTGAGYILKIRLDAMNGDFLEAEGRGLQGARRTQ